ncbi:MAG: hypothetical protein FWD06_10905, partial [Oscillospiraceae bacterium]|nr:hypothetical protein [Oscillospiraceae bacterium]
MKKIALKVVSIILVAALLVVGQPLHGFVPARAFVFPVTQLDELPGTPEMPTQVSRHVSEIVERRTADSRHFRNEDGTYTAYVYPQVIHFQDADGNWQEIDNTLVRQGDFYVPRASGMDVQFPAIMGENEITMHSGQHGFSLGVPNANSEAVVVDLNMLQLALMAALVEELDFGEAQDIDLSNLNNAASVDFEDLPVEWFNQQMTTARNLQSIVYYMDVWPGAHLEYVLSADGLKENIIVPEPKAQYVYEFSLNLYNLDAVQHNERTIRLYCAQRGTPVMTIEAPFARDAAGVENTRALTLQLSGNTLTLTADAAWMNAPEREFPVVLDPTYFFVADLDRIVQVRVNNQRGTNYGVRGFFNQNMYVGSRASNSASDGIFRSRGYIRFEMPQMPQDAAVVNASMLLDDNSSPWWVRMFNILMPFISRAISLFVPNISLGGLISISTDVFEIPILGNLLLSVFSGWVGSGDGTAFLQIPLGQLINDLPRMVWHAVISGLSHVDSVSDALERGYKVNVRAERVIEDWSGAQYGSRTMNWESQPASTGVALSLGEQFEQEGGRAWIDALRGALGRGVPLTGLYTFDITEAVQHWERYGENHGIRLLADNENLTSQNMLEFAMPAPIAFDVAQYLFGTAAFITRLLGLIPGAVVVTEPLYYILAFLGPVAAIPNALNAMEAMPQISIQYICTTGLQPFFSYETVNMGRAGTAHINHLSGGLTVTHPTLQLDGERMPVGLSHVYTSNHDRHQANSRRAPGNRSPGQIWGMNFGTGFHLNVIEKITPPYYFTPYNRRQAVAEMYHRMMNWARPDHYDEESWLLWLEEAYEELSGAQRAYRMFVDSTGGMHRFVQREDEPFVFEKNTNPDITMRWATNRDETSFNPLILPYFIIEDELGNQRIFRVAYADWDNWFWDLRDGQYHNLRPYYYLVAIRDANGNETNIFYNRRGQIDRIVDTIGRTINLNWDSNGYLLSITCPIGRVTSFAYEHERFGSGDDRVSVLTHITYHDGRQTHFHYEQFSDSNRDAHNRTRLAAVTNHDDHTFAFGLQPLPNWARTNYRVASVMHGVGAIITDSTTSGGTSSGPLIRWANPNGWFLQRWLHQASTFFAGAIALVVTVFTGEPTWIDVDDYGNWNWSSGEREIPVHGEEEILLDFDWRSGEILSVTMLHYGKNYTNLHGSIHGRMTTVVNSLGEPEGLTYIFDRMGRAVAARDNAEDNHAFVLFTESEGVQNLPGFMAGAAIVENLFNPTGWLNATHAFAGNNSRIAWQAAPTRNLSQTVHNVERGTYTVSFYAMSETGTAQLFANGVQHDLDVTNRWERHSVTFDHQNPNIEIEIRALSGYVYVEGLQLEQNAGASPFNHVANSHFARELADRNGQNPNWRSARVGLEDGLEHDDEVGFLQRAWSALSGNAPAVPPREGLVDGSYWMQGNPNTTRALWQPIYLGANAAGQMLLFGATVQMNATRSEPFYTRVAVRFYDADGNLIELETDFDCDDDDCDDCYENDCDIVGNVRENQVFAAFNRDVRGVQQTAAMAHTVPDDAVRANLYIVYHEQASGNANAMRVDNAFVYIGAGGSTMSYLGGRVSEVRSNSGTMVYTWQADGPNVQSIEIIRPNRDELEDNDRIDFEYDTRHNVTRIVERRHTDDGENLITETLFDYISTPVMRYSNRTWAPTNADRFRTTAANGFAMRAFPIGGILSGSTVLTYVGNLTDEDNNIWTPNGTPLASYQTVTYVHDYNDVRRVADSNGSYIYYYYDSRNRNIVTQVRTSDGSLFNYGYNEFDLGALNTSDMNFIRDRSHAFDVLNRISAFAGYSDGEAVWISNQYDFTGMGVQSDTITGLLRSIRRTNGTTYTFQYNHLGQVEQVAIGGQVMVTNTYVQEHEVDHSLGLRRFALARRTYANGFRFTPMYDQRGRVIGERWNGLLTYSYTFADNGMLAQVQNHNLRRNTDFMYDTQGRLTSIHAQRTGGTSAMLDSRVRLGFNDDGALDILRMSLNGDEISRVEYFYDSFERPYRAELMGTQQLHSFDESTGRLIGTTLGPLSTTFDFDDRAGRAAGRNVLLAGNLTQISHYIGQEQLMRFGYAYREGSGNIERIYVDGELRNSFEYDQIGQLVRDVSPGRDSRYAYDIGGNLVEWRVNDVVQRTFYYGNANWPDQLTGVRDAGGALMPITYDALGNMLSFNGRNFTWQRGR